MATIDLCEDGPSFKFKKNEQVTFTNTLTCKTELSADDGLFKNNASYKLEPGEEVKIQMPKSDMSGKKFYYENCDAGSTARNGTINISG